VVARWAAGWIFKLVRINHRFQIAKFIDVVFDTLTFANSETIWEYWMYWAFLERAVPHRLALG
jgi:hypothetical protein